MGKLKITRVNNLLFCVVILLTIAPLVLQFVLDKYFYINILDMIQNNENIKNWALFINQYALVFLPVVFFCIFNRVNLKKTFRLNPVSLPSIVLTMIMAVSVWIVSEFLTIALYHLYSIIFHEIPQNDIAEMIPQSVVLGFALIVLSPAVCEEVLFRGVVLKAYENLGTVRAIVISAILFSIIHLSAIRFVGPLLIGLLSGYLVIRSNSIIPGIIMHFTFNGITLAIFYSARKLPEQTAKFPSAAEYIFLLIFVVFAMTILAGCIGAFNYFTKPRGKTDNSNIFRKAAGLLIFNQNSSEEIRLRRPYNTIGHDFISIVTHWPIAAIIIIVGLININDLIDAILK